MRLLESSAKGALKKFRRTPWRFQQTVQTPLKDLDRFVTVILAANSNLQNAALTISEVVFESEPLNEILVNNNLPTDPGSGTTIESENPIETHALLKATLSGWIDFLFIPTPKPFVIFADHDEYTTIYANTKSALNSVINPLENAGYTLVENWTRSF